MTTDKDSLQKRLQNDALGEPREFTLGVPIDGMVDPTGEYPRRDYFFNSSINKAATGAKINDLHYGGSTYGISYEIQPQKASLYPFNQVNETPSGHVIEIDDTPGGERILIKHETGAGVEMKPDGSLIINSRKNTIQVSAGDQKVTIGGNGEITYEGSLTLNVTGDYNVNVGGNYNVNAKSSYSEFVGDMKRVEVTRTSSEVVRGNKQSTVGGNEFKLNLKTYRHAGKTSIENYTNGEYLIHSSDDVKMTSKRNVAISGKKSSIVGEEIYAVGTAGKIGGNSVDHFGKLYTGPDNGSGDKTTFYGSLVGKATEAWTAEFAQKSKFARRSFTSDHAFQANKAGECLVAKSQDEGLTLSIDTTIYHEVPDTYDPLMTMPWYIDSAIDRAAKQTNTGLYLETSQYGIKDVNVDHDNTSQLNVSIYDNYFHYFRSEPSIHEIRSAFRAFNLRSPTVNQASCIQTLLKEGRLSKFYNNPTPPAIGRVENAEVGEYLGETLLGNPLENRSKKFSAGRKTIPERLSDPRYSKNVQRDWHKEFTAATKLSDTQTLGEYLGSIGDPRSTSNLSNNKVDQLSLVDNLRKHSEIVDLVNNAPAFKNQRFVVTEGYADLLPEVEFDDGVLNAIPSGKKDGSVAVYKLLNAAGKMDLAKTFDLAVYLKDHAIFEWIALDYDTFDPNGLLSCQIIIGTNPLEESLLGSLAGVIGLSDTYDIFTYFNQTLLAKEFVEVLPQSV